MRLWGHDVPYLPTSLVLTPRRKRRKKLGHSILLDQILRRRKMGNEVMGAKDSSSSTFSPLQSQSSCCRKIRKCGVQKTVNSDRNEDHPFHPFRSFRLWPGGGGRFVFYFSLPNGATLQTELEPNVCSFASASSTVPMLPPEAYHNAASQPLPILPITPYSVDSSIMSTTRGLEHGVPRSSPKSCVAEVFGSQIFCAEWVKS